MPAAEQKRRCRAGVRKSLYTLMRSCFGGAAAAEPRDACWRKLAEDVVVAAVVVVVAVRVRVAIFERGVCVHSSGLFHGGDEGRREGEGGVTVAMLDRSE